jgi:hypothetical protein
MGELKRIADRIASAKAAKPVRDLPAGKRLRFRVANGRAVPEHVEIPMPELAEMARRKIATPASEMEEMVLDALEAVDGVRAANKPLPPKSQATKDRLSSRVNGRAAKLAAIDAALDAGDRVGLVGLTSGNLLAEIPGF